MKHYFFAFLLMFVLALVSAVPAPLLGAAAVPAGLGAADWAAIQAFLPSDYVKASNTGGDDRFGTAVAVDGDTVVVGAKEEDSNGTNPTNDSTPNAGAVYVFTRTGGVWSQQAYLKASNTGAGDHFGTDVAIAGDTIVVGASGEASNGTGVNSASQNDNSAPNAGAAYVFSHVEGVWSQQAYLKASNTGEGDYFGGAVTIAGNTVVVGAIGEASNGTDPMDNSASGAGAVYVFTRTGGVWNQQGYLKASNTEAGDQFGIAVDVSGDTIIVGAWGEDGSGTGVNSPSQGDNSVPASGAAYIFTRNNEGGWAQQTYLKASNTGAFDQFGNAVAIDGNTAVIGATWEASNATGIDGNQANDSAPMAGAAYIFIRTGEVWSQQAYLKASNTDAQDEFGFTVAIAGDTVVVGAPSESSNGTGSNSASQGDNSVPWSGAAYVFTRTGMVWSQQAYLKASTTGEADAFGFAVAVEGNTVVVGAPGEDSSGIGVNSASQDDNLADDSGAVYIFAQPQPLAIVYLPLVVR